MWILQGALPPDFGAGNGPFSFRLAPGAVKTVGRAPRADFILDVALVSRLHCRLSAEEDRLEVVDLSSTNGTFVNDKRIERAVLGSGDRLRVGRVELTIGRA
jgi:pSer/pThr/pTyr-binding forkhead associated (FHA) protein